MEFCSSELTTVNKQQLAKYGSTSRADVFTDWTGAAVGGRLTVCMAIAAHHVCKGSKPAKSAAGFVDSRRPFSRLEKGAAAPETGLTYAEE